MLTIYCLLEIHLQGLLCLALARLKQIMRGKKFGFLNPGLRLHEEVIASIANLIGSTVAENSTSYLPHCQKMMK
jgi:hypothetical protein